MSLIIQNEIIPALYNSFYFSSTNIFCTGKFISFLFYFLVGVIFFLIFLSELLWKKLIPHHSIAFKQSKTLSDWKCLIFWFSEETKSHFPVNFHLNVFPLQCLSLWQVTPTTKNICFHFFQTRSIETLLFAILNRKELYYQNNFKSEKKISRWWWNGEEFF